MQREKARHAKQIAQDGIVIDFLEAQKEMERQRIWESNPLSGRGFTFAAGFFLVHLIASLWDAICLYGDWSRECLIAKTGARPDKGLEEGAVSVIGVTAIICIAMLSALFAILG